MQLFWSKLLLNWWHSAFRRMHTPLLMNRVRSVFVDTFLYPILLQKISVFQIIGGRFFAPIIYCRLLFRVKLVLLLFPFRWKLPIVWLSSEEISALTNFLPRNISAKFSAKKITVLVKIFSDEMSGSTGVAEREGCIAGFSQKCNNGATNHCHCCPDNGNVDTTKIIRGFQNCLPTLLISAFDSFIVIPTVFLCFFWFSICVPLCRWLWPGYQLHTFCPKWNCQGFILRLSPISSFLTHCFQLLPPIPAKAL